MKQLKNIALSVLIMISSNSVFAVAMDTINRVDANNMKQGHWVYTNKMKRLPGYRDDQVVEEGDYQDDKKSGKWVFYYNNDKIKHVLTYSANKPNGYAVFYYKNGNKREEGIWKNNRWVGEYKYYYENGNLRNEWQYNEQGKRTGVQKYYHENGQLQIEGTWNNGQEAGTITEYYDDGSLKSTRTYNNGKIDDTQTQSYQPKEKAGKVEKAPQAEKQPEVAQEQNNDTAEVTTNVAYTKPEQKKAADTRFNGNGYNEFLNKDGKVTRKGTFENGYLMDGEVYMYTSDGELFRTTYYKGGRVVKIVNHQEGTTTN